MKYTCVGFLFSYYLLFIILYGSLGNDCIKFPRRCVQELWFPESSFLCCLFFKYFFLSILLGGIFFLDTKIPMFIGLSKTKPLTTFRLFISSTKIV